MRETLDNDRATTTFCNTEALLGSKVPRNFVRMGISEVGLQSTRWNSEHTGGYPVIEEPRVTSGITSFIGSIFFEAFARSVEAERNGKTSKPRRIERPNEAQNGFYGPTTQPPPTGTASAARPQHPHQQPPAEKNRALGKRILATT